MHSVADDTSGRTAASFWSMDIVVPRSGGGHCTLRSTAAGTINEAATSDLATSVARIIPLPRLQLTNSHTNEKKQSVCRTSRPAWFPNRTGFLSKFGKGGTPAKTRFNAGTKSGHRA